MKPPRPRNRPTLPSYGEACLEAVARTGLGHKISLAGAYGLLHYLDYRSTHDIDAWWQPQATPEDRRRVVETVRDALAPAGEVEVRSWGDVVSVELVQDEKKVFSFQIARRSAQLEPPRSAPGVDVLLDSFADLVASKMTALVERGAPRDFRDVFHLCEAGLLTARESWSLWRRRHQLAGTVADSARARLAVETHLRRIQCHRPLAKIASVQEREEAARVRRWYSQEFLHALLD